MHLILHQIQRRHIFVTAESCWVDDSCWFPNRQKKEKKMGASLEIHNKPRKFSKVPLLVLNIQIA